MASTSPDDPATLVRQTHQGGRVRLRALGKLVSLIENNPPVVDMLPRTLGCRASAHGGGREQLPYVVGFTGPPGVGKSTAVDAAVAHYSGAGLYVAVLAIDPSQVAGSGAFLGDRLRLRSTVHPDRLFFRSLATRGALGGINAAIPAIVHALNHCQMDLVIIETVGVGQNEVDVAALADSTIVFVSPGSGDGVQAQKAGLLDVADVVVVNQSDRDGSQALVTALQRALELRRDTERAVPVVTSVATEQGGLREVLAQIDLARTGGITHGNRPATSAARERLALQSAVTLQTTAWAQTPHVQEVIASLRSGETSLWQAIGVLRRSLV